MVIMKEEANIMSVKGTVRGVKNRVKTGIATFLQDQKKKVKKQKWEIFQITFPCSELYRHRGRALRSVCNLSGHCEGDQDQVQQCQEDS